MLDRPRVDYDQAEVIAIRLLGAMASDPIKMGRFLTATGTQPGAIRSLVDDPRFLASIVDFVADDVEMLEEFIGEGVCRPAEVEMASYALRQPARTRD